MPSGKRDRQTVILGGQEQPALSTPTAMAGDAHAAEMEEAPQPAPPPTESAPSFTTTTTTPEPSIHGDIIPPASHTYEQRIRIIEAWQYDGHLHRAPAWIDRNWAAWGDYDRLRQIEPGPAVRVPTGDTDRAVFARVGDYIVHQEVTIAPGVTDLRIEVWAREQFEKFFLMVS